MTTLLYVEHANGQIKDGSLKALTAAKELGQPVHALALVAISMFALHALVCTIGFAGHDADEHGGLAFAHFTLAGYGLALLVSLYVLWTFGRLEGQGINEVVRSVVVLGFPASLGAAAARLLV